MKSKIWCTYYKHIHRFRCNTTGSLLRQILQESFPMLCNGAYHTTLYEHRQKISP